MDKENEKQPYAYAFDFTQPPERTLPEYLKSIPDLEKRTVLLSFAKESDIAQSVPAIAAAKEQYPHVNFQAETLPHVLLGLALGSPIGYPKRAVVEIYNDCNLACDFCWTHSPYRDPSTVQAGFLSSKLDKESIFSYLDELAAMHVEIVEFCAVGDPMFHPDIWEILRYTEGKGFSLRLSTNGTLITREKAKKIIEAGVKELFMNISAGDRDTYAQIHNVSPVLFDNLRNNLKYLSTLEGHPKSYIINVITEKNAHGLFEMIRFAEEVGAHFLDIRKVWISRDYLNAVDFKSATLRKLMEQKDQILQSLREKGMLSNIENFFVEVESDLRGREEKNILDDASTYKKYAKKKENSPWAPCHAPGWEPENASHLNLSAERSACAVAYHFTLLDVNRDLRFCCMDDKVVGGHKNIREQWYSPRYQSFREHWKKNLEHKRGNCNGCPHVEENRIYFSEMKRLGLLREED